MEMLQRPLTMSEQDNRMMLKARELRAAQDRMIERAPEFEPAMNRAARRRAAKLARKFERA